MKTKIRLARFGAKKKPFYRIVVAPSSSPRNGRMLEIVGTYDPTKGVDAAILKKDRVEHWLKVGAQPTEVVHRILKQLNTTTA